MNTSEGEQLVEEVLGPSVEGLLKVHIHGWLRAVTSMLAPDENLRI